MKDSEFYKYRQSVKAFLSIALDGNVHSWALWEQIANQLELLWDNIGNRSGADLDFVVMYRDRLQDIRHGMQETYSDCGYDKKECGKRINTAIGGLVEKLNLTAARTGKEQPTPQQAGKFVPDSRLTTDKAQAMFDAFEKAGFITKLEDGHLKWANNHSRAQFKYFVEKASDYLNLTGSNRRGKVYCRKPFEDYFDFYKTSTFGIVKIDKSIRIDEIFSSLK